MSQPASAAECFKRQDAGSYDHVSDRFDVFSRMLSVPFARRLIALARLDGSEAILDVGTGTGIVALNAASRLNPLGNVVGIDLSEGMLSKAAETAVGQGLSSRVEFRAMDAEALAFEDASFDVVLSLFALLHLPNPSVAVGEIFRVLRPGGRLALAVGSRPPLVSAAAAARAFQWVLWAASRRLGRLLVAPAFLEGLAEKHLPATAEPLESDMAHASLNRTGRVAKLVRDAGFIGIRTGWHGYSAELSTADDFWEIQRTLSSNARKRLAQAPASALAVLRREFFSRCDAVEAKGGRFVYPMGAFFVTARKPAGSD